MAQITFLLHDRRKKSHGDFTDRTLAGYVPKCPGRQLFKGPCELLVRHVADGAAFRGNSSVEALEGEGAGRNASEPDSAS